MQRRLSLTEGTSDKFWYIDVVDAQITVRYGRRGTAGTTKTKDYESPEKALAEAEKQVAAKVKKGYSDEAGASTKALQPVAPTTAAKAKPSAKATSRPASPTDPAPAAEAKAAKVSTEAPSQVEEGAAPEVAARPIQVAAGDADDLGLVITPFEQAFDLSTAVHVERDTEPFDPEAELARAERIVSFVPYSDGYSTYERVSFSEPPFTTLPSAERRRWWQEYLKQRRNPKRQQPGFWGPTSNWPLWLKALLERSWRSPSSLLRANDIVPLMVARPMIKVWDPDKLAVVRRNLPSPLPAPVTRDRYGAYKLTDTTIYQAAALEALDPTVATELLGDIPRGALADEYDDKALLGIVLPTPEERVAFARRTGASLNSWRAVVPWLVATGRHGFGFLVDALNTASRGIAEAMLSTVAEVAHGPGVVELFVDALDSKAADVAGAWLNAHLPQVLAAPLNPTRAKAVAPILRQLPLTQLSGLAATTSGNILAVIDSIIADAAIPELPADTGWWAEAAADLPKAQALPFNVQGLPPLRVDGQHRLSPTQVAELLRAMSATAEHPLVAAVRDRSGRTHRDEFALAVLKLWLNSGAPAKQSWLMTGAGWLGDSAFVHTLTPMIREWPGISQHQRAVKGLTALRNVATDEALQQISGIAAKVKFAGLKKRAGEAMDEIAAQRGFTRDELEDRVLGDGGLDERGTARFDYGPRQFLAYVTPEAKLAARLIGPDGRPTGKVLSTLPAPNKSDDPEQAKTAKADYNAMKKTVTALAKIQVDRFERAMVTDRRWSGADHAQFIAPHPVLRRLLAGVIWSVYDNGTLVATARIDEDGILVDTDDEPVTTDSLSIGVAHRLDLDDEQLSAWAEILADYELTAPFKQLDRPVYTLPTDQGDDTALHGLPTDKYPATKLMGAFSRYGWERGEALDAGTYCLHGLVIPSAGITPVIQYSGMWMGPLSEQEDQQIESCFVVKGAVDPKDLGWGDGWDMKDRQKVPWSQVPAKITSEVLATIAAITS